LLRARWPELRARIATQLLSADELRALLAAAGCPTDPAAIGVSPAQLRRSYDLARTIRSRYTVLDLVAETGMLEDCLAELFGPGGYWAAALR
jgi:glycerol-1-phosphate dehydrogenase [NAD(P)+]